MAFFGLGHDVLKEGFVISGKKIVVLFIWDEYSSRVYNNDFKEIVAYQTQKAKRGTKAENAIDLKFYRHIKEFEKINYNVFKELVEKFMLRIVYEVLKDNPAIVTADADVFEIQIKIVRVKDRAWYGSYEEDISDTNHVYMQYSGLWLLNTIVVPWGLSDRQKIDYKVLYKFMTHELVHHIEIIKKKYWVEDYAKQKYRTVARRNANYSVFYLYLVFENLRVEGIAEFRDKSGMPRVEFKTENIRSFRIRIEQLIKMRRARDAEAFYEQNFGAGAYGSLYYVGRLMVFTTGLAVLKKEGKAKMATIILPNKTTLPITGIEQAMNSSYFDVTQLPPDIFNQTFNMVGERRYREFVDLYEWACNELRISERNRIVTRAFFDRMKKEATNWYEKNRLKDVKKRGYIPTEYRLERT